MTPCALLRQTAARFRQAGIPDPETDSALILSFLCRRPPLSLRLDTDTVLDPDTLESFAALADRRLTREPLQYILGEAPFCGRFFRVDKRVLIPRPETEELCRWALDLLPSGANLRVLDLCAGSGCIGLTIAAERPGCSVTLSDISEDALAVARGNAASLDVRVSFSQSDLMSEFPKDSFDLVVSNPPYIPAGECLSLQPEVLREPVLALSGGTDGLDCYRRIASDAPRVLKAGGKLLMELGFGESAAVSVLLRKAGASDIVVRKDLSGVDRMILAVFSPGRNYV